MKVDMFMASAGTGKTHALMNVLDDLLAQGVPIERIGFVTFTKKGADVIQQRVSERCGYTVRALQKQHKIGTIHSLCYHRCDTPKDVMVDNDKLKVLADKLGMKFTLRDARSIYEGVDWEDLKLTQLVGLQQLYRCNPERYEQITSGGMRFSHKELIDFTTLYTQFKNVNGYVDFEDLLQKYIDTALEEDVDYVLVDEAQDNSPKLWQVLLRAYKNVERMWIAGDMKQSVFRWAGAEPEMLLKLRAEHHYLDISYRVPSRILSFADDIVKLLSFNDGTKCKSKNEGGEVVHINMLSELAMYWNSNESWMLLARNNAMLKQYADWCVENGIQFSLKGVPYTTQSDWYDFGRGEMGHFDKSKLEFMQMRYKLGLGYEEPKVFINTIHTVKGDEADNVVLMSDIGRLTQQSMVCDEDSEHCVWYVACTRAKKNLFIILPQTRCYYPYIV